MKSSNSNKIRLVLVVVVVVIIACGGNVKADFTFGEPTNLGPAINYTGEDAGACISADGLELYFQRGTGQMFLAHRATPDDEWGPPSNLGPTFGAGPCLSADGLLLYFMADLPGGSWNVDLWMSTRTTLKDEWGTPVKLGPTINSSYGDYTPSISADGLELYFASDRPGGSGNWDLWVTTRATTDDNWETPTNLGPTLNTSMEDNWPGISPDGLLLFFGSNRSGGLGSWDIYMVRRATTKDPWGPPINLGPVVNSTTWETGTKVSPDGSMLYFNSPRPGGVGASDIWQAPIEPVVDFNGDEFVNNEDMCIMIDNWGTDEPLCDIGPMPWGDGIVDVQDLIVLAEHLLPVLLAHWEFDEIEGGITYDSSGDYDGMLNGDPLWQPAGGKVNGALLMDGIDDYVNTHFIIDPARGSSSTFAWIKGGGPGQVIISQVGDSGEIWLGIDTSEGKLITGFCDVYFDPLVSDAVITDGQWHHVGLVYDLDVFHRRLYVDGTLVIEDTSSVAGVSSDGGLHIGASKNLEGGSFFSGLIDDVRIYRRALSSQEIAALAQ